MRGAHWQIADGLVMDAGILMYTADASKREYEATLLMNLAEIKWMFKLDNNV